MPTCLAAHTLPKDYNISAPQYLSLVTSELLPYIRENRLANRLDIFIEDAAFTISEARQYLLQAKKMNFDLTVHADQFTVGGSKIAAEFNAISADHLEVSSVKEIEELIHAKVICTVLPGASIGLGCNFAPARMILDRGGCLVIASDQNPGSAPHGDLLMLASIMATFEKLSTAEVFAAITYRAAQALRLPDRGIIASGHNADFIGFPTSDYREILYHQGNLKPNHIWKNGMKVFYHEP